MSQNNKLSLHDFKNWLSEQKGMSEFFNLSKDSEDPNEKFVGKSVRPKVGPAKLLEKIETDDDADLLVQEFCEQGGNILAVEDKLVHIEVESGQFTVPRFCVRLQKH